MTVSFGLIQPSCKAEHWLNAQAGLLPKPDKPSELAPSYSGQALCTRERHLQAFPKKSPTRQVAIALMANLFAEKVNVTDSAQWNLNLVMRDSVGKYQVVG